MIASLYRILPVFVIVVCYVKIYKTIRYHNMEGAPSTQEGNSAYGVAEAKITRILTAVIVGFCVCWFPGFTYIVASLKTF